MFHLYMKERHSNVILVRLYSDQKLPSGGTRNAFMKLRVPMNVNIVMLSIHRNQTFKDIFKQDMKRENHFYVTFAIKIILQKLLCEHILQDSTVIVNLLNVRCVVMKIHINQA